MRSTKTALVGNKNSFLRVNVEVEGDGIACGEYIDHGESRDWWLRCSDRAERGVRQEIVIFGSEEVSNIRAS